MKTFLWECLKTIKEAEKSELETWHTFVLKEMFVIFTVSLAPLEGYAALIISVYYKQIKSCKEF